MRERQAEFFTIIFRGDIRKLPFNPMTAETAFGEVIGVAVGDLMEDYEELENIVALSKARP